MCVSSPGFRIRSALREWLSGGERGLPRRRRLSQHSAMPPPRRQCLADAVWVHRVTAQSAEPGASSRIERLKALGKSYPGTTRTSPILAKTVRDRPRRKV